MRNVKSWKWEDLYDRQPGSRVQCNRCLKHFQNEQGRIMPADFTEFFDGRPLSTRVTFVCNACQPMFVDRLVTERGPISDGLMVVMQRRLWHAGFNGY